MIRNVGFRLRSKTVLVRVVL
eukprot:SAG31_NODE_48891_length_164_cov_11.400000_1_plen_20_part_01